MTKMALAAIRNNMSVYSHKLKNDIKWTFPDDDT